MGVKTSVEAKTEAGIENAGNLNDYGSFIMGQNGENADEKKLQLGEVEKEKESVNVKDDVDVLNEESEELQSGEGIGKSTIVNNEKKISELGKHTREFDEDWEFEHQVRKMARLAEKRIDFEQDARSNNILRFGIFADESWRWVRENKKGYIEWCVWMVLMERRLELEHDNGFTKSTETLFGAGKKDMFVDYLEPFVEWILDIQNGNWIMGFGKHHDQEWSAVLNQDSDYTSWCVRTRDAESVSPGLKMFADWADNKTFIPESFYHEDDPCANAGLRGGNVELEDQNDSSSQDDNQEKAEKVDGAKCDNDKDCSSAPDESVKREKYSKCESGEGKDI